uniref:Uncharacterized protein n=1 Tax=Phytophthora ramorum TaxID=164328 RepID=H3HCU1_PHYRM
MFGATALHLLCMNEMISTDLLRTMLLMCSEDSFTQDAHGRSPLHYMCMNQAISPELLWLFFDRGHDLVHQIDKDERTPLHYLCSNVKVTPRVLEILFDSWPSAALVSDQAEIRDDHVNYSPTVHETFENAKRRLTPRSIDVTPEDHNGAIVDVSSDVTIVLDYAVVMEAPLYTLEGLRAEKLCDTEATLQNVGQFEDRGLCLYNMSTGRELYEKRTIGSHAITLSSCPPEAAKAFVFKEEFLPNAESDMWQFGCLVYLIEDGVSLPPFVTSEAPSHDFVGKTLQQKAEDALADGTEGPRSVKYAQEQLEFMKKEQSLSRHTLLSAKSQLRDVDQAHNSLQARMEELQIQLASETKQRQEAQLEAQLLARNHQSMTFQLHTTVQMLLNLVPLARKVYGAAADDFLSSTLAQATGGVSPSNFPPNLRRKSGPVQHLKRQLQHSVLAHGCVQKWGNSSSPSNATESLIPDENIDTNSMPTIDHEDKSRAQVEGDPDSSAAPMA